jgi:hypothetical protein
MKLLKTSLQPNLEQLELLKKLIDFRFGNWELGMGHWLLTLLALFPLLPIYF